MAQEITIKQLFEDHLSLAWEQIAAYEYPYEVLADIGNIIKKDWSRSSADRFEKREGDIWVAKSRQLRRPPAEWASYYDEEAEIRHCAFIRGNVIVGKGAVVGNSTELKNVILFDGVQVPHYNYVGDSILGYKSHMGAGSITSNVKSDKTLVEIRVGDKKIPTGRKKVGAILGSFVEVGCGSILNPGTVIGSHSNVYPLSSVRGYVPGRSIYKNQNEVIKKHE